MGSVEQRLFSLAGSADTPPYEMRPKRGNESNEVAYEFLR
jgi:hypothetical protein